MNKATRFLHAFGVSGYVLGNDRQIALHPNAERKPNHGISQLSRQVHVWNRA